MRITRAPPDDRDAIRDRERLLDVKVSLLSVLADAAVVVHAIGDIGILLNLGNEDSLTDRVQRAGLNKERIALLDRNCVQNLKERIILDPLRELLL